MFEMFVILFRARGRVPPGAPGRPSYKKVEDAPRKIRFSRLETSLGVVQAFLAPKFGKYRFVYFYRDISRYLCLKVFPIPIFQGSQKTLIVIVVIFFREYSLRFMGVKMPIFRITQLSYVT